MTVTSETSRVSYTGDGPTATFAVPFYFIANADLKVVKRTVAGVEMTLTLTTDYTVSGAGNQNGGSVTLLVAPTAGETVVVYRDPARKQEADYVEGGRFPAASHERSLDRIVMMVQRVWELVTRSLVLRETDTDGSGAYLAKGNRITGLATPTSSSDAATKAYVDALSAGGSIEAAIQAAADADADRIAAAASAAAAAQSAADAAAVGGFDPALYLTKAGNLTGIASPSAARSTLGLATVAATGAYADLTGKPTLGDAAAKNTGTTAGTLAAGDDSRFDTSALAPKASPSFTGTPLAPTAAPGTSTTQLATTAFVDTSYAKKDSPALTGTPTAPTATGGTNTTQLATTAFVTSAVAAVAAPSTTLGAVSTYAFLLNGGVPITAGTTYAGSGLTYSDASNKAAATSPAGTWRAMGSADNSVATLFVRTV